MKRGDVLADVAAGHPAVIVHAADAFNMKALLVVPLTDAAGHGPGLSRWIHRCDKARNPGLPKDSVAVVPWVESFPRKTLEKKKVLCTLSADDLDQIGAKLRLILDV